MVILIWWAELNPPNHQIKITVKCATHMVYCMNHLVLCRCARFLLHYKHHAEEYLSHIRPQTCYAYSLEQGSQKQLSHLKPRFPVSRPSTPHVYNRNAFEQPSWKPQSVSPSDRQSLLPDIGWKQTRKTSISDTRLPKKEMPESTTIRATVSDQHLACAKPDVPSPPNSKSADHQKTPSHANRTLRYTAHHIPQAPSRVSSAMVKTLILCPIVPLLFLI